MLTMAMMKEARNKENLQFKVGLYDGDVKYLSTIEGSM
jgi:hypothetical protein